MLVGDGSYLMLNSEIAASVALGRKLIVVVLNTGGFGCIDRLQASCGTDGYNNLLDTSYATPEAAPSIDFAAHARSLGAQAEKSTVSTPWARRSSAPAMHNAPTSS